MHRRQNVILSSKKLTGGEPVFWASIAKSLYIMLNKPILAFEELRDHPSSMRGQRERDSHISLLRDEKMDTNFGRHSCPLNNDARLSNISLAQAIANLGESAHGLMSLGLCSPASARSLRERNGGLASKPSLEKKVYQESLASGLKSGQGLPLNQRSEALSERSGYYGSNYT